MPKYIVTGEKIKGQILDAETRQPVGNAALAIRWVDEPSEEKEGSRAFKTVQTTSGPDGAFEIPQYPGKSYVMGIYKDGYVCWSSRDIFPAGSGKDGTMVYRKRTGMVLEDGMLIELQPFGEQYERDHHAGFTVMVAGEASDSSKGPFQQAVEPQYRLWRDSLRKDFRKKFGSDVAAKVK